MTTSAASTNGASRAVILEAAAVLFRERGYNGAALRDIALAVGIKAGSIYYHFPSKEQIAIEVMNQGINIVRQGVELALSKLPSTADAVERLRVAMRAHLSVLLDESSFTSAHIRMFSFVPPEVRTEVLIARSVYDRVWTELVDDLARSGVLRSGVEPKTLRLAILGSLNWSLEWYRPDGATPEGLSQEWFEIFAWGALRP